MAIPASAIDIGYVQYRLARVTMEAVREMDPEIETLNAVLEHWDLAVGSGPITVGAMIGALMRAPATGAGGGSPATTFRDLLLGIAGEGVAINGKKLGKWLTANAGRIVNGRRIVRGGLSRGLLRWGIETAEGKTNAA